MKGGFWFPVPRALDACPWWRRQPDRDLAILLLRDAHERRSPTVVFSLAVFRERTAWWQGNVRRTHGRDALRNGLGRLEREGFLTLPDPAARQRQGRQQGHFAVTLCDFDGWRRSRSEQATRQTTSAQRAANERATPREEEQEERQEEGLKPRGRERPQGHAPDARIDSLKQEWLELYARTVGERPAVFNHGAWGRLCKAALKSHVEADLRFRMDVFFGHERARLCGYHFGAFFRDLALWRDGGGAPPASRTDDVLRRFVEGDEA